jgi:hypothetical protein
MGIADETPCPECGIPFDFAERQAVCAELADKPYKLWWQLVRFQPPPSGWWEVFDRPGLHKFTPLRTGAIILISAILSASIMALANFGINGIRVQRTAKAWLYRDDDPKKTKVADYGSGNETTTYFDRKPRGTHVQFSPHPVPGMTTQVDWTEKIVVTRPRLLEYTIYPSAVALFLIGGWLIYRHLWLNLLLRYHPTLSDAERASARRAAAPLSLVFLALPLAMFLLLVLVFFFARLIDFQTWGFILTTGFTIVYPPLLFMRTLRADTAGYVFPNRTLALILIIASALLHVVILSLCMVTASALFRTLS